MGRKDGLDSRRKNKTKTKTKKKKSELSHNEKSARLRDHWRKYKRRVGCFNCGKKRVELEFSHFKQRTEADKLPAKMVNYKVPTTRESHAQKLEVELGKGGLLCQSCHARYDAGENEPKTQPEAPWADTYKASGADHWPDYLREFMAESEKLDPK